MDAETIQLALAFAAMAALYATVGHGGGSGYLAVLAFTAMAPAEMRATALSMNLVVAAIATWRFSRGGRHRFDLLVPLACASIPAAAVGGYVDLPMSIYGPLVGIVLLAAAARLAAPLRGAESSSLPPRAVLVAAGGSIGLLSGIVGVGGGIFLSPLILVAGWATARQVAAISAPFILVNSAAAMAGMVIDEGALPMAPGDLWPLATAVAAGGLVGATIGSRYLGHMALRRSLAVVLLLAAAKMVLR